METEIKLQKPQGKRKYKNVFRVLCKIPALKMV